MKLKIFITKNILEQSKTCSKWNTSGRNKEKLVSQNCAVAKAIVSLFGFRSIVLQDRIMISKMGNINVSNFINHLYQNTETIQILLPEIAKNFIKEFDDLSVKKRVQMTPISFEIDVPEELVEKLGFNWMHKIVETQPQLQLV